MWSCCRLWERGAGDTVSAEPHCLRRRQQETLLPLSNKCHWKPVDAQARGACHLWERQKMLFFWAIAILGGSKRRFRQTVVVVGSNERRFHQSLVIARDIRRRYHSYMTIATRNQKMYERKAFACSSRGTALCQPPYRRIGMALFTNALWQRGRTPVLRSLGTVFDSLLWKKEYISFVQLRPALCRFGDASGSLALQAI